MTITATNPNGTITISANSPATRVISGAGFKHTSELIPRETRWNGSLGLYDPASSRTSGGRFLVDEGRQFFETESEALRFLYVGSAKMKPVFTNSGLVVGYDIVQIPNQEPTRSITLYQIYIAGKKPTTLRGADDSAISVENNSIPDVATPNSAPIGYERVLGNEEYEGQRTKR